MVGMSDEVITTSEAARIAGLRPNEVRVVFRAAAVPFSRAEMCFLWQRSAAMAVLTALGRDAARFVCDHCGRSFPFSQRAGGEKAHYRGSICEQCFRKQSEAQLRQRGGA